MKKKVVLLLLIPVLAFLFFSCGSSTVDAKKLEGKWNIIEVKGDKIDKEGFPNLEFNMKEKKVHGNTGCNIYNSSIVLDEKNISHITFEQGMSTMMACPNMDIETAVLRALNEVRSVKAGESETQINLVNDKDQIVLVLSR